MAALNLLMDFYFILLVLFCCFCFILFFFFFTVYTRWRNLKKTSDMEIGAIGFHDSTKVKNLWVVKDKEIVKRIEKTKDVREY